MSAWKPRYCERCGVAVKRARGGKDAGKYCSKACYFDHVREGKQQFGGKVYDAWTRMFDWFGEWEKQRPKPRKERDRAARPACVQCGVECNREASRFCSYACNKAWRGPRACRCGVVVPEATAFGPSPSCDECRKQSRRIQGRMRKGYKQRCMAFGGFFNASVKPKDVFARDAWRCHICNRKTHKVFNSRDPRSATVDHHPIPLSKGGDHDWYNVRCACLQCNAVKGNKWDGQARLPMQMIRQV